MPTSLETASPTLLLILDGWGYRENPNSNAISMANTPVWDKLIATRPNTLIHTSGMQVGLPDGQMGNSEVGHMNLGAGRIVYQSLTRINKAITDGSFLKNTALCHAIDQVIEKGTALHVMGLLSPGGIHSHENQIQTLIEMAQQRGCTKIYLHAILDGRDTPPRSAATSLQKFHDILKTSKSKAQIATVSGRFYGMDRDNRWDRIEQAYQLITQGKASYQAETPMAALEAAYTRNENDEFVAPTSIHLNDEPAISMENGDGLIFMNFRADRSRELSKAFSSPNFSEFIRGQVPALCAFVTLTQYSDDIEAAIAFPPQPLQNVLGEYLAKHNKTQLRIAETEKYAHVTFFFSGGREQEFKGEARILVPSPDVVTYDLKPEMSAFEVCDLLVDAIKSKKYDAIICNFANGDMVGHTGVITAAIKAVEVLDECMGKITNAILEVNGNCLITADHGNVEQLLDEVSGQPLTSHTNGPVPLVYVGKQHLRINSDGALSDIAPSLLSLMGLEQPVEMTGKSLLEFI